MKKTNGIILVDKPVNYTSRDVVNVISKVVGTKKVGHTGTLDPLATGVMVVLFGKYTKLVEMLSSLDKEYIAEIKLGIETDTLDITGNVTKRKDFKISKEDILRVLDSFKGKYKMEVPKYSAIKVKGKKLYEYARNNEEVILPIKEVEIYDLELLEYKDGYIKFRAYVSKGTYIRSLIRDICKRLNTVGVMQELRRTKQGIFKIEDTNTIEDIRNNSFKIWDINDILDVLEYQLNEEEYLKVKNGSKIIILENSNYLLMKYLDKDIALYKKEDNYYKPFIML